MHFGFKNEPDVPQALQLLAGRGVPLDEMDTSYFLSRDIVMPTIGDGMSLWREKLFANMHRNAAAAARMTWCATPRPMAWRPRPRPCAGPWRLRATPPSATKP
mgnify:CR=1 FL=1